MRSVASGWRWKVPPDEPLLSRTANRTAGLELPLTAGEVPAPGPVGDHLTPSAETECTLQKV